MPMLRVLWTIRPSWAGVPLTSISRFEVRLGRLQQQGTRCDGSSIFGQKQVDLLFGLDIALLSGRQQITHATLVAGDGDLVPAVELAKREGVSLWLVHGPSVAADHQTGTYSRELWQAADWTTRDRSGILGPSGAPVLTTLPVGCVGSKVGAASRSKSARCLSRGKRASAMRRSRRRAPRSSSSAESSSAR